MEYLIGGLDDRSLMYLKVSRVRVGTGFVHPDEYNVCGALGPGSSGVLRLSLDCQGFKAS